MDDHYLRQLPDDLQTLVQGTEQQSGLVIQVEVDPARGATVACHVDEHGATLLVSGEESFQPASVMHELLHIRRFLVDGVPQIVVNEDYNDWTPELERGLTNLDNGLEHLVIVPEEIFRFPGRREYWAGVMTRKFEEIRVNPLVPDDRRRHALVNWLFTHHVLMEGPQILAADSLVDELGLRQQADAFRDAMIPALAMKQEAVRRCFQRLNIPFAAVALKYIDSRARRSRAVALEPAT
ncbi:MULTISPECIES: hypothetical protein [Burkholderia]|uniref:Uncharacterized protein n=1 Tax=Burkholderia pseudomallei (strain K96243) TaxID=272560 RepID=Q63WZ5_BURPS|nr:MULTISPECIES: hypothetical protein [Burkholderia]AJX27515.1 hypothetical protein AQ15_713 [Burkholderia pseudomallei K96243]MDE3327286.1 hypothetical protein [Burkholderia pseudomallei]RFS56070.1 hypothetical protein D0U05_13775 [Burkholderia pseudomallei]RFS62041.1 hypothetical protein D0U02_15190 [Burkholderia pseudomallei]RFS70108.1 hypothetical protein D0U01_05940 [Burkholderia pseudomallei]